MYKFLNLRKNKNLNIFIKLNNFQFNIEILIIINVQVLLQSVFVVKRVESFYYQMKYFFKISLKEFFESLVD